RAQAARLPSGGAPMAVGMIRSLRAAARARARFALHASLAVLALLGSAIRAQAAIIATIDEGPVAGQPSVKIGADGLPVVAYRTLDAKLRIAKCRDHDCSDPMRIELTGTYASTEHFTLAITPNGFPAIAFQDKVERRLDVVRCVTADCTGGGHAFFTIDPGPNDVGAYVDWAFGPDQRAAFAYRDFVTKALMLARCVTPACTTVGIEMLDGIGQAQTGDNIALAFAG